MIKKKSKVSLVVVLMVALGLLLSGCGGSGTSGGVSTEQGNEAVEEATNGLAEDGLQVVASISIIADMAANILGERGQVEYLVPIGENPEDYELIPSQFSQVSDADLLLINGFGLEELIEGAMNNVTSTPIVYVTDGVSIINLVDSDEADPHAWLDVNGAGVYVDNILAAFIAADPDGAEYYNSQAADYREQLAQLDSWIKEQVAVIPDANKTIVVSENAFKYYGEAYGFQTEGIWELNSHEEGTPQQLTRIIELVREQNLPGIFVETTLSSRYMDTIARETGVPIAGIVYTDALGAPGSGAATYLELMRHNTKVFVEGLK